MKLQILEKGRLNNSNMLYITGGETWTNCSDSGTACPQVSGNNFTITKNCAHNLYSCGSKMQFCVSKDDLAACSGLPSDAKGVVRPI